MLLTVLAVIIICTLIPQRLDYYDGGTYEYRAILYKVIVYHRLPPSPELEYTTGKEVQLFGLPIYKNIKNLYSVKEIIKYQNNRDVLTVNYENKDEELIIDNYNDFSDKIKDLEEDSKTNLLEKYDEEFFNKYNLVYVIINSNEISYVGSHIKDNTITIGYKYLSGTQEATNLMLVRVNKEVNKIKLTDTEK